MIIICPACGLEASTFEGVMDREPMIAPHGASPCALDGYPLPEGAILLKAPKIAPSRQEIQYKRLMGQKRA